MPPTLRRLLANPELDLRLLTAENALPAQALDQVVQWVHSSDLADPTPFLSDGQVLLITGTQFDPAAAAPADFLPYVTRLRDRGLRQWRQRAGPRCGPGRQSATAGSVCRSRHLKQ